MSYSQVQSRPGLRQQSRRMCFVQSRRHGLVPRRNTKAYFLRNNAGCYQLCNNHRLPVRSQSMAVKIMRIDWVAHKLLGELIADCLGHTFETHVRSFINKGHVIKYSTKLPALSFHLEKLRLCAQLEWMQPVSMLPLWGSREKPRESSTQKKTQVVHMREVLEAVGFCQCAPSFRLVLLNLLAHRSG